MALFWFARLGHVVPNHLTGDDPESVVAADERAQVRGRSMLVKRLKPLPIEAVVRGYLAGSGWKEYQQSGAVCGVMLPPGLSNASKLPAPIFTPATKAEMGDHDENIDFERAARHRRRRPRGEGARHRDPPLQRGGGVRAHARASSSPTPSSSSASTTHGTLTLMDEVLTPDSSRFWPAASATSRAATRRARQAVRARLARAGQRRRRAVEQEAAGAAAAGRVVEETAARYRAALEALA